MTNDKYCFEITEGQPAELRIWLDIATRGLGKIGIRRAVDDIARHYRKAIQSALEEDVDIETAETTALLKLGEPRTARRKFNRVYLTEFEEGMIVPFPQKYPKSQWFFAGIFVVLSVQMFWVTFHFGQPIEAYQWSILVIYPMMVYLYSPIPNYVSRYLTRQGRYRMLCYVKSFSGLLTCGIISGILLPLQEYPSVIFWMLCLIPCILYISLETRIARKLPKILDDTDMQLLENDAEPAP
jgi:hypothetical protein